MPNARHVLSGLAGAGDPWQGPRDDWASTESRGIGIRPPLGRSPWAGAPLRLREPYHCEMPFVMGSRSRRRLMDYVCIHTTLGTGVLSCTWADVGMARGI
jgi:hypothetical protein